jgi:hypothetical protein
MENKKTCFKCNTEKPLSDYYKHKKMGDGHLGKCKECTKKDSKKREEILRNDVVYINGEKERCREKYHRLGYKYKTPNFEKKKEAMRKHKMKYPEKQKARNSSQRMKPKIKGNELHHWSYNEEHFKDVIELSVADHNKAHRHMVYDAERKMYRRADNNILLDTKEAHIEFINSLN